MPFELHIPGYNYCGPGTKLEQRLARGDKPINKLDEACMAHDIAYSKEKDVKSRHEADKLLAERSLARYRSHDASFGEKLAALGVSGIMRSKVKLGLGCSIKSKSVAYNKLLQKHLKSLDRVMKTVERSQKILMDDLNKLQELYPNRKKEKTSRKSQNKNISLNSTENDSKVKKCLINRNKRKLSDSDNDNCNEGVSVKRPKLDDNNNLIALPIAKRKRKLNETEGHNNVKKRCLINENDEYSN